MHEKSIQRRYLIELFGAIGVHSVLLALAVVYGKDLPAGAARTLVLSSPIIGIALAVWAIVRQMGRVDEFVRKINLENIAIAAAVTAALALSYGYLELAGFPRVSMFAVWPVMGASWLATAALRGHFAT